MLYNEMIGTKRHPLSKTDFLLVFVLTTIVSTVIKFLTVTGVSTN
jgi:hypothetical protein